MMANIGSVVHADGAVGASVRYEITPVVGGIFQLHKIQISR